MNIAIASGALPVCEESNLIVALGDLEDLSQNSLNFLSETLEQIKSVYKCINNEINNLKDGSSSNEDFGEMKFEEQFLRPKTILHQTSAENSFSHSKARSAGSCRVTKQYLVR
jgi:ferritin